MGAATRTKWRIAGEEVANCNCAWGCPCQFNALPTYGDCRAAIGYEIEEGHFGDVPLDGLRARKQEISDAVKIDLTNFFATRGVTITTVGMFGGMTYENPEIQKAIDQTFIAQQLKVVAEAKFESQKKENERIELEAQGIAEKSRREAQGLADARKTAAAGEAEAIRAINAAALEAQQNPLLLQLKTLEVEKARIEKWDGRYPQMWLGGSGNGGFTPSLLIPVPAMERTQVPATASK